jgi:hypothetical protein
MTTSPMELELVGLGSFYIGRLDVIINIIHTAQLIVLHFWVGSFCCVFDNNNRPTYPRGVIAISDIVTLIEDMSNQIPDKSWMLYMLEIFKREHSI